MKIINRIKHKAIKGFNNAYLMDKIIEQKINYKIREEMLRNSALYSNEKGIEQFDEQNENIIISLTTYSKRIYDVYLVIESLLQQTHKPNKIILWLNENEFNEHTLPLVLKRQQTRGLAISYCKDLKSYKKLIPALAKYSNHIIITIDDDVIYPFDMIENMYKEYLKDSQCIYYGRGHKMTWNKKGYLNHYQDWILEYSGEEKSHIHFPTGCSGILYPPHCFHEDISREDLFMKLAPNADDVWFKAMSLLKGFPCKKSLFSDNCIDIEKNQDIALYNNNVKNNMNDIYIKQVFDYYNLWVNLKSNKYDKENY
ncbi:MAG: hypothetical protein LBJ63_09090 [Prevotellaceae bacterium]|jgi:hypothetical protein|nr:hypothetical protein [Prevotellaceae bacterium]